MKTPWPHGETGIVLVIGLVFLAILSLAAAAAVRMAGSSEAVASNTRREVAALQAADAALLYCERAVREHAVSSAPGLAPKAAPANAVAYEWESLASWDGAASTLRVLAAPLSRGFKRAAECMAQYRAPGIVVITARGFGPEVAPPGHTRAAPMGTEVWLQSVVSLTGSGRSWRQIHPRGQ